MEFRDLISSSPVEVRNQSEEARFSFLQGGYIEDFDFKGSLLPLFYFFCNGTALMKKGF